jgi:hypothetical protein
MDRPRTKPSPLSAGTLATTLLFLSTLGVGSGCSFLTGAAAGATGGYVASEEGVDVQSPVEMEDDEEDSE